jgi:pimeloyl-ACP methyl ester carboxylesterase
MEFLPDAHPLFRIHGSPPYRTAVIHGGPGAAGECSPLAAALSAGRGVLEPMQTAKSAEGQIRELSGLLGKKADPPVTLVGFSWGAWLSLLVAAERPALVGRLILVSSGPFEEKYAGRIHAARLARLAPPERSEMESIAAILSDPDAAGSETAFARLAVLASKADAADPMPGHAVQADDVRLDPEIFKSVWKDAAEWRRNGRLLESAARIACPVIAIHGDADPHPFEGVREPLSRVVKDFHFILLERCGHRPWIERHAREAFYRCLERELESGLEQDGSDLRL